MDIVVWLRGLGLGKYEATFRENEIDERSHPTSRRRTSKSLASPHSGVAVLLDAIEALRADTGGKAPPLTCRARPAPQAYLPKTAPSVVKSR